MEALAFHPGGSVLISAFEERRVLAWALQNDTAGLMVRFAGEILVPAFGSGLLYDTAMPRKMKGSGGLPAPRRARERWPRCLGQISVIRKWITQRGARSSCCLLHRDCIEVCRIRGLSTERGMRPARVIEVEVRCELSASLGDALVGMQIDVLLLDAAPQSLDDDVVDPATLAVHADLDALVFQDIHEIGAGELAALVGVEDFRRAKLLDRFFQSLDAEVGRHADRHAVRQHLAGGPVENRDQIDETPLHRDVGQLGGPDLVRSVDRQALQQVRIDRVFRMRCAGVALAVDRCDLHLAHQRAGMLAADLDSFAVEHVAQHPGAGERKLQVQFVDPAHHGQVGRRYRLRQVIDVRARDVHQLGLATNRQRMRSIDHFFALRRPCDRARLPKNHSPAPVGRSSPACP